MVTNLDVPMNWIVQHHHQNHSWTGTLKNAACRIQCNNGGSRTLLIQLHLYIYIHNVHVYVYIYICMYIYIYIYQYHLYIWSPKSVRVTTPFAHEGNESDVGEVRLGWFHHPQAGILWGMHLSSGERREPFGATTRVSQPFDRHGIMEWKKIQDLKNKAQLFWCRLRVQGFWSPFRTTIVTHIESEPVTRGFQNIQPLHWKCLKRLYSSTYGHFNIYKTDF